MSSLPSTTGTSQKNLHSQFLSPPQQQHQQREEESGFFGISRFRSNSGSTPLSSSFEDEANGTLARLENFGANFDRRRKASFSNGNTRPSPFIIGICGGSASGKTTVCREIISTLSNKRVITISQDSFYRNLTPEENELANNSDFNFDSPQAFDYDSFEHVVDQVKSGASVEIPIYDFKTNSRLVGVSERLPSADVILIEGILVFHTKALRDMMDMKIFVDTDADVSLARRIRRDIKERGRSVESILTQYEKFVKPSYDDFIMPTKKYADIIIPRGGANGVAIDLIAQHIKMKLNQIASMSY